MVLDEQQYIRQILTDYFVRASQKNPRYSIRSFAKKLDVSSSSLSEILRGRRKISIKKALVFAEKIKLPAKEIAKLREFKNEAGIDSLAKLSNPFREVILNRDQFDLLADWKFFAIVALMRTKDFKSDEGWIARRLSLRESEVKSALARLITLGIVSRTLDGKLTEQRCTYRTSEDYPQDLIRSRQVEGLGAAISSIRANQEGQIGCYSTISADPKNLKIAARMMEEFLKKLSIFIHDGEPKEVFELHLQLFPRTTS